MAMPWYSIWLAPNQIRTTVVSCMISMMTGNIMREHAIDAQGRVGEVEVRVVEAALLGRRAVERADHAHAR